MLASSFCQLTTRATLRATCSVVSVRIFRQIKISSTISFANINFVVLWCENDKVLTNCSLDLAGHYVLLKYQREAYSLSCI